MKKTEIQNPVEYTRRSKRLLDIFLSLAILLIVLPFILFTLIALKLEQILRGRWKDPLFYSETRMSYGKPFTLYKFNIFKYEEILAAKARGEFIHTKNYERNGGITRIGWILKQIYMDELPQFFSVLKGDLSIVGPRPVNLEVHKILVDAGTTDKNRVPGGITGNFQSYKDTEGANAILLDKEYADYYHQQPWYKLLLFDCKIIFRTLKVILLAKGI